MRLAPWGVSLELTQHALGALGGVSSALHTPMVLFQCLDPSFSLPEHWCPEDALPTGSLDTLAPVTTQCHWALPLHHTAWRFGFF